MLIQSRYHGIKKADCVSFSFVADHHQSTRRFKTTGFGAHSNNTLFPSYFIQ